MYQTRILRNPARRFARKTTESGTGSGDGSFGSRRCLEPEGEAFMRRLFLMIAALAAIMLLPSAFTDRANAMTNPLPAGIANAVQDVNAAEQVAYVCRRRCNWRGCWRRCWHTGPVYYGVRRPYRHRYWRRW
jgi:hypothetical protein